MKDLLLGLLVGFKHLVDHVLGTQDDRHTLVDGVRRDVHDSFLARRGDTTGLLDDVRHGRSLVQQTQLAVRVLLLVLVDEGQEAVGPMFHENYLAVLDVLLLSASFFLKNHQALTHV